MSTAIKYRIIIACVALSVAAIGSLSVSVARADTPPPAGYYADVVDVYGTCDIGSFVPCPVGLTYTVPANNLLVGYWIVVVSQPATCNSCGPFWSGPWDQINRQTGDNACSYAAAYAGACAGATGGEYGGAANAYPSGVSEGTTVSVIAGFATVYGGSASGSYHLKIYYILTNDPNLATPTPTVAPTATPFAVTQYPVCVTATPSPSATPYGTPWPSPTYIGTYTRTITATPTPTGTVIPGSQNDYFASGVADFNNGMQPWALLGGAWQPSENNTRWQFNAQYGPIVILQDSIDAVGGFSTTVESNLVGALAYDLPRSMPLPIRISGSGRYHEIREGEHAYLDFYYLDPDYAGPGNGRWVSQSSARVELTNEWAQWVAYLVVDPAAAGSGRATRVAIVETLEDGEGSAVWWTQPWRIDIGTTEAYVDNLEVRAGSRGMDYPVCAGGYTGSTFNSPPRICTINTKVIDVYAHCTKPAQWWDIVEWTGYWWCRALAFFTPVPANNTQITDIQAAAGDINVFGYIGEFGDALGEVAATLGSINATWWATDYRSSTYNWSNLVNWQTLDTPPTVDFSTYKTMGEIQKNCPTLILYASQNTQRSACFVIAVARERAPLFLLQWLIDGMAVITALAYINKNWLND